MPFSDSLGDRMKGYENINRTNLVGRMPYIIRIDGRAFHSYTRKFSKPWDINIKDCLTSVAKQLLSEISGSKLAYIQSDEISILVTTYDRLESQPWFGNNVQKIVSIGASVASAVFNEQMKQKPVESPGMAIFDARCFCIPKEEVCNYFIWRQNDAIRNSVQGLAQKNFSHKRLQGVNTADAKCLLSAKGIEWDSIEKWKQHGWCIHRSKNNESGRSSIVEDDNCPIFKIERDYIDNHVFLVLDES